MIQSALSTEYIRIPVSVTVHGSPYNPTSDPVSFAFVTSGSPGSSDWHTGSWDTVAGAYFALCLVGPGAGGVPLAAGNYLIWLRITDNPEIPTRPVAQLAIY